MHRSWNFLDVKIVETFKLRIVFEVLNIGQHEKKGKKMNL